MVHKSQNLVKKPVKIFAFYCDSLISRRSQVRVPRFIMQFFGDDSITEQNEALQSELHQ